MERSNDMEVDSVNSVICEYTRVMDDYAVAHLKASVKPETKVNTKKARTCLILCLDKSGSMDGEPIKATKKGAIEVAKMFSETNNFDALIAMPFDSDVEFLEYTDFETFRNSLNYSLIADGGTCFGNIFKKINQKFGSEKNIAYDDFTIMFMTDGCTEDRKDALKLLDTLKTQFNINQINYRFF